MEASATETHNAHAAAETLNSLEALVNGKQCLPELEEEEPDSIEPDVEQDRSSDTPEITFTEKDRKDFPRLEKKLTGGTRQVAEAAREIRQRQLWRLLKDDQGKQLYANFEEYCQERHGHSRQWVTHLTNWLAMLEEGERQGILVPLSVRAAQGLLTGRLQDAGGLRAVLEEAKEDGVPLDRDHLRAIVIRRAEFNYYSKDGTQGVNKPAAMTYADYKKDVATVQELGNGPSDSGIVKKARELDGEFADNLLTLCQQERVLPKQTSLLAVLTGKPLEDVVARLKETAKESVEIEEKKKTLAARKKEIRAIQQEGGLKKLKDEAKALEQELDSKGVLKKKKKGTAQPEPGEPEAGSSVPASSDESGEKVEDADVSEVRDNLAAALESLDDALTCEWAVDSDELNAILAVAQDCETKLAGITAKVKELLADTEKPEAVPSGDD